MALALIYLVITFVNTLLFGIDVHGYPSLLITLLFLGGIIIFGLGVIGEYIGRIFDEIKQRPLYVIPEQIGEPD